MVTVATCPISPGWIVVAKDSALEELETTAPASGISAKGSSWTEKYREDYKKAGRVCCGGALQTH